MKLPIFQVDAFAEKLFQGNPAAVVPLKEWLADKLMQAIAMENNLSETAFFVPTKAGFNIRWFTPKAEVDLCGHATLATAHIIFNEANYPKSTLSLDSRSGNLTVTKLNDLLQLDFPADTIQPIEEPTELSQAVGKTPSACFLGKTDYLFVYDSQHELEQMQPDFGTLTQTGARGIIVTAPGNDCDFVSRFFAPGLGIDEDPVTGSAHTTLMPYWTDRLQQQELSARQISSRGGQLQCTLQGDRVLIAGKATTYLRGEIFIDS
ncbi:PhzF family phenazine biosynthesis protein [Sunxiuqinia sp. sy24]|uniref:PhzF family phenazine biosynthesis protein n=1 Tax=Sunxiuqinia sp. sy24 TaxID=3461495 RepID=UPI004045B660